MRADELFKEDDLGAFNASKPAGSQEFELTKGPPYPPGDMPKVRDFQSKLDKLGYNLGPPGIDGKFGPYTAAALAAFQKDYKLPEPTGTTYDNTDQSMLAQVAAGKVAKVPTPTKPSSTMPSIVRGDFKLDKTKAGTAPTGGSVANDPEFDKRLSQVADNLNIDKKVFRDIIRFETAGTFSPSKRDPKNISVGLIGFTEKTANRLGTTRDELAKMSAVEQLDYVEKYYKRLKLKPHSDLGTIYMMTFLPAFAYSPDDTVIGQRGGGPLKLPSGSESKLTLDQIWQANPVFGKSVGRDQFTVGDVKRTIQARSSKPEAQPMGESTNPADRVAMDVPLLLRIMEYSKEDAKTDMDLHHVVEKLIELSSSGETLTMANYNDIIDNVHEASGSPDGLASAEKLVKDIEYDVDNDDVQEGYGRYWCSTDKRWKDRKGPKQSRG